MRPSLSNIHEFIVIERKWIKFENDSDNSKLSEKPLMDQFLSSFFRK